MFRDSSFEACDIPALNHLVETVSTKYGFKVWYPYHNFSDINKQPAFQCVSFPPAGTGVRAHVMYLGDTKTKYIVSTNVYILDDRHLPAWEPRIGLERHRADFDVYWWQITEDLLTDIFTRTLDTYDKALQQSAIHEINSSSLTLAEVIHA